MGVMMIPWRLAASVLVLHCLLMSQNKDARLIWVNMVCVNAQGPNMGCVNAQGPYTTN